MTELTQLLWPDLDAQSLRALTASTVRAGVWAVGGLILALGVERLVVRVMTAGVHRERGVFWGRVAFYTLFVVALTSVLKELGFDLSVVLGAAGIVTVALGFASQTSASNLISGLFLIAEKPFKVGDFIAIGATSGTVLSIDTLSIKLQTLDNVFVRIPNEQVIKGEVRNFSRFEIRRLDLPLGVSYREDLDRVKAILLAIADAEPQCFTEPEPQVVLTGFGDSQINLELRVWAQRNRYLDVRTRLYAQVKRRFDEEGVEIPFPQRVMHVEPTRTPAPRSPARDDGDGAQSG